MINQSLDPVRKDTVRRAIVDGVPCLVIPLVTTNPTDSSRTGFAAMRQQIVKEAYDYVREQIGEIEVKRSYVNKEVSKLTGYAPSYVAKIINNDKRLSMAKTSVS
jgi:hypothetical protein